jgi:hypothetical protein
LGAQAGALDLHQGSGRHSLSWHDRCARQGHDHGRRSRKRNPVRGRQGTDTLVQSDLTAGD